MNSDIMDVDESGQLADAVSNQLGDDDESSIINVKEAESIANEHTSMERNETSKSHKSKYLRRA